MSNERELLELASKAMGIDLIWSSEPGWAPKLKTNRMQSWNPHDDDGDCARMEAALGIGVEWYSDSVVVRTIGRNRHLRAASYAAHGGDRNAARRDASLQLAAAIGKAIP